MKNFWFKFEWEVWLNDDELSACSLETQGFWLRCIAMMHRAEVAEFTGSIDQLRRKFGILPEELTRCLQDLKANNAADVRFGNGDVSIKSRRLDRELKAKQNNRLYVARHREKVECKTDVSPQRKIKRKIEIKSKKEEKKKAAAATDSEWLESLATNPAYHEINVPIEFSKAQVWAAANNRQVTRRFFVNWINRTRPMEKTNATAKPTSEREKSASRQVAGYSIADQLEREARAEMEAIRSLNDAGCPENRQLGERSGFDGNGTRIEGQGLV